MDEASIKRGLSDILRGKTKMGKQGIKKREFIFL
jgi:hypothetical protein